MIGEIGGTAEEKAADFVAPEKIAKPIVGFVAGLTAPPRPAHGPCRRHHLGRQGRGPGQDRGHAERRHRGGGNRPPPSAPRCRTCCDAGRAPGGRRERRPRRGFRLPRRRRPRRHRAAPRPVSARSRLRRPESWRRIFANEAVAPAGRAGACAGSRTGARTGGRGGAVAGGLPEPRPTAAPAAERGRRGRPGPGRDDRFHPRAHDDPRLPGARPSHRLPRPPRPRGRAAPPGARPQELRLLGSRLRPPHLCRRRARAEAGDAARGAGDPQADLLRAHRRRVHAHPVPGAEVPGCSG